MPGRLRRAASAAWGARSTTAAPRTQGNASASGNPVWVNQVGITAFSPWGSARYAEAGYKCNVIARCCVRLIAAAVASLPLLPFRGEDEAGDNDPLRLLLDRPNPWQGTDRFLQALAGHHLIGGDTWLEAVPP